MDSNQRTLSKSIVKLPDDLSPFDIKAAHDHLRTAGASILDDPWEPDDFGKLLYQINEISRSKVGPREQQIAFRLIHAAEQILLEAGIGRADADANGEDVAQSAPIDELKETLELAIVDIAEGALEGALYEEDYVTTIDANRGPLWNLVAWAILPLHNAKDERLWYIASARFGLYGHPETLDSIGLYLGITRERTRQLESMIRNATVEDTGSEWGYEWKERATQIWSADYSGFALGFDSAVYFGHEHMDDAGAILPTIGELLHKHKAIYDVSELELWARVKNWLDLDDHSDLLSDAYRAISRAEKRTVLVPGAEDLAQVVKLSRYALRHNGAVDIADIAASRGVPETALLLALGRDAAITHVPGTSWVAALHEAQGSLRHRIGKLLSNAGPLDAETVATCLGKVRPGRESFATALPPDVMAAILDLTPGVVREKTNVIGPTRWLWTLPRISLGEISDSILLALRTIPSPFTRSSAYKACAPVTKVSIDVFIAGPFCITVGRDAHQLIEDM